MNIWSKFRALIPDTPLQLAVITTDHLNGSYTVTLTGGGNLKVLGTGFSVGDKVFVRGTLIESTAPTLPSFNSEVS